MADDLEVPRTVSWCECGAIVIHNRAFLCEPCPVCGQVRWEKQMGYHRAIANVEGENHG